MRLPFVPATVQSGGKTVSQLQPRPVKPGLHVGLRNSQYRGCLLDAQMLNIPKDKNLAVLRTEQIDCILDGLPDLVLFEYFRWNGPPIREILRPKISFFILLLLVDRFVKVLPGFLYL